MYYSDIKLRYNYKFKILLFSILFPRYSLSCTKLQTILPWYTISLSLSFSFKFYLHYLDNCKFTWKKKKTRINISTGCPAEIGMNKLAQHFHQRNKWIYVWWKYLHSKAKCAKNVNRVVFNAAISMGHPASVTVSVTNCIRLPLYT